MVEKRLSSWRRAMPNYPKLTWEDKDLGVLLKPAGIRGWWGFRTIIPYLTADVLRLTLFVDKAKIEERRFYYTWSLLQHLPDGSQKHVQQHEGSFTSSLEHKVKSFAGTARIISPGHYSALLELKTHDGEKTRSTRQTMAIITALAGDVWRTDTALRALFLIIGVILGIFGTLLITGFGNSGG